MRRAVYLLLCCAALVVPYCKSIATQSRRCGSQPAVSQSSRPPDIVFVDSKEKEFFKFCLDGTSLMEELESLTVWPKLLVLDLDETLWTPALSKIRRRDAPRINRDIQLIDEARIVLQVLAGLVQKSNQGMELAIASRCDRRDAAHGLLESFEINPLVDDSSSSSSTTPTRLKSLFRHVQIHQGSKKKHFTKLQRTTGYDYSEMVFFDDNACRNLSGVRNLGVLCCHTPHGLSVACFLKTLRKYNQLHLEAHSTILEDL